MHKSTFDPTIHPIHVKVARKFASILLDAKSSILSQHIPGKINVADSLSRAFHLSNNTLTSMIFFMYPNQMPENFQIFPAPEWLSSWLESLLPNKTMTQGSPMKQERSNLEPLADGKDFYNDVRYMTHSLQHFFKSQQK